MTTPSPLRIAVIGAGPSGFFLAEKLLGQDGVPVTVDLFERLPTPYGLVRFGVAPDHEKIKNVTRSFDKLAGRPGFRFFGNVEIGRHVTLDELKQHYHLICFTTGAQSDRRMGIPGEDLAGSHPATEFVAWYNGHPDYRDHVFDLSAERVAVVGVGNVAVDVARILAKSPEELARTDIADHALEALRQSRVKEVYLLGRRGPAQAAFTNPEVKELGELEGADIAVRPDEVALDPVSEAALAANDDAATRKKLEILQEYARREPSGKPKRLTLRFLVSPTELVDDGQGRVKAIRLVRNRLVAGADGSIRAEPTGNTEELPVELVFRSVGYRGSAIPGLPFDERRGTVPHAAGRVLDPATGAPVTGCYVSGWIKRGPSGVIGTNKPCAAETAETMLADAAAGARLHPAEADIEALVRQRQPDLVTWADWVRLNAAETAAGQSSGRPRVKLTRVEEMVRAIRT
ncbi:MAG TPA: FAD-dependent oxidoreductase [Gemmatimonadales bacterium]|nr:FAD-dependent oxidoreductase [Gemmatimonadales bacterium]